MTLVGSLARDGGGRGNPLGLAPIGKYKGICRRGPGSLPPPDPSAGPRRVKKWITVGMLYVTAARWEGTEQDACTSHCILNLPPWFYIRWGNTDGNNDAPMWIYNM